MLDAEAEGLAMQKITYSLEAKLTQAEIELSSLKNQMSEESLIVKKVSKWKLRL
ncbi:hypothetical protein QW180_08555 [Vibrio sinaloensis]|nr:hypothetical protein [Vibrio sinaloensis]